MANYVKAIIYTAVAVWAIVLLVTGQKLSSDLLRPLSTVTSVVVLLSIAFELWLWKLPFLHGWFVKRPGARREPGAPSCAPTGKMPAALPFRPWKGYVVIRQTFLNLSLRLMTKESSSHLVGTEIVCSVDGLYCVSGVYRNEPRYQDRSHSEIHFGAVWLQVIDTPTQMLQGHYWTDRNTAGEMLLTDRQKPKFQDFKSAQAHYAQLPAKKT